MTMDEDDNAQVTAISYAIQAMLAGCWDDMDYEGAIKAALIGIVIFSSPDTLSDDEELYTDVQEMLKAVLFNRRMALDAQQAMADKVHHTEQ
jgi:hypothetical protein